jgi:hypothetical protein
MKLYGAVSANDIAVALNEKYGDGVLDLDSGKFIPSTQ